MIYLMRKKLLEIFSDYQVFIHFKSDLIQIA